MEQFLHDKCVHCTCMTLLHESYANMDKHLQNFNRQCIISMNVPKINESLSLIALCWINMFYLYWPLKKKSA